MVQIKRQDNPPATKEEIDAFAERWSYTLPPAYVAFLLETNGGGDPQPNLFPMEGLENNPAGDIVYFYGLHAKSKMGDLDHLLERIPDNVPYEILPIGMNGFGDEIVWT